MKNQYDTLLKLGMSPEEAIYFLEHTVEAFIRDYKSISISINTLSAKQWVFEEIEYEV